MILCKRIGDFFEKSILSSINTLIMLAVISLFTATDSYSKPKGSLKDLDTLVSGVLEPHKKPILKNTQDQGVTFTELGISKHQNQGNAFTELGINNKDLNNLPPIEKEMLKVVKGAAKTLGKFYLNKANIEAALGEKVQITLPGAIILDKIADVTPSLKPSKDNANGQIDTGDKSEDTNGQIDAGDKSGDANGQIDAGDKSGDANGQIDAGDKSGDANGQASAGDKSEDTNGQIDTGDKSGDANGQGGKGNKSEEEGAATQLAGLSDDSTMGDPAILQAAVDEDLSKSSDKDAIVGALKEFFTESGLQAQLTVTSDANGLQVTDLSNQVEFNKFMGKLLLKSFALKTNGLFKSKAYGDVVYESEFIKNLVESFGNTALADSIHENDSAEEFMHLLIENNLLHFALSTEGEELLVEVSFHVNNGVETKHLDNLKDSFTKFAEAEGLLTEIPSLQKLYHYVIAIGKLEKNKSLFGTAPMKKISEKVKLNESADKVYLMVLEDVFINEFKESLKSDANLKDNLLKDVKSFEAFIKKILEKRNTLEFELTGLVNNLEQITPEKLFELSTNFVKEVVITALNSNKSANSYAAGSLMKALVALLGKEELDEGGNYGSYSLKEYLSNGNSENGDIINNAISEFYSTYALNYSESNSNNYVGIIAKGGHQKRFANLANALVTSLSSTKKIDLLFLVNNDISQFGNAALKAFNEGDKSVTPALYFNITESKPMLELEGVEKSYLYNTEGGSSYIQFNSLEESILAKIFNAVHFDAEKKVRLSILSTSYNYSVLNKKLASLAEDTITSNEYSNLNALHSALNKKLDTVDTYTIEYGSLSFIGLSPELMVAGKLSDIINENALKEEFGSDVLIECMFDASTGNNFIWMKSKTAKSLGKSALVGITISFPEYAKEDLKQFIYEGFYNILSGQIWYAPRMDTINIKELKGKNSNINNIAEVLSFLKDPTLENTKLADNIGSSKKGPSKLPLISIASVKASIAYTQAAAMFTLAAQALREKAFEMLDKAKLVLIPKL